MSDACERQHASFEDAAADFAVDASYELPRLVADAFYLSHRLGVSGSQSFSTSIVCLGDRRGQADCFVYQLVQIQLQIEFSWSRCQPFGRITAVP